MILLVGLTVGALMALVGAGVGALTVPLSVHLLGYDYHDATIAGLVVVMVSGAVNSLLSARRGEVRFRAALPFVLITTPIALLVGHFGKSIPEAVTALLISLVLLIFATSLLRPVRSEQGKNWKGWLGAAFAGASAGALGLGGGFVIVPSLRIITRLSIASSVATGSVILTGNAAAALIGKGEFPSLELWLLGGCAACGVLLGRMLTKKISARVRQFGLAAMLYLFSLITLLDVITRLRSGA